jgi:ATP-binding cassette, subfamily B, bacterial
MKIQEKLKDVVLTTFNVKRAFGFVWKSSRGWTIANLVLLFIQGMLPVVTLYLLKVLVDTVAEGTDAAGPEDMSEKVLLVLAAVGLAALLTGISRTLGLVVNKEQSRRVVDHMHDVIQKKATAVDLEYYENSAYQDTLHRAQEEAVYRPGVIVNSLASLFRNSISLIGVGWLLFSFRPLVLLLLVAAMVPPLCIRILFSEREYLLERKYTSRERRAAYYHFMLVGREFAKEIRIFGLGPTFIKRFQALRKELRKIRLALDLKTARYGAASHLFSTVLVFGAYLWVARDALVGRISLGAFVMFYQAFQRGQSFLQAVLENAAKLYENNLFLTNLYEFLDIKYRIAVEKNILHPKQVEDQHAAVAFENLWFTYPGTDKEILRGVNLRLHHGEVAALVGLNGAGKTTLVKLLCRLYDPDKGSVFLDGTNIRGIEPEELRKKLGVIFQDYAHYNLTVRDNIWFGNVDYSEISPDIVNAARKAGIHEEIEKLTEGYNEVLGRFFDKGSELSIGQWQKIALARAFFRDAPVVVLDEPTSSMDPRAEFELFSGFRDILDGRTAFLISHRMSTVRMADRIFVLNSGRIVESGTHEELLAEGGIYAELFETQARNYQEQGVV